MRIIINDEPVEIAKEDLTVSELLEIRNIPLGGTAIAINNRLIKHQDWFATQLNEGDFVTVISAAFGG